jgi:outer membrane protein, heavy metal efflux system
MLARKIPALLLSAALLSGAVGCQTTGFRPFAFNEAKQQATSSAPELPQSGPSTNQVIAERSFESASVQSNTQFPELRLATYSTEAGGEQQAKNASTIPAIPNSMNAVLAAAAQPIASPIPLNEQQWNLESLEALALQHNPAIIQAQSTLAKIQGFREQVGLRPNPTVGYNATQLADAGTDQHTGFYRQDIVTGGKLQSNRAVLDREYDSMLWEVETQRFRVRTDIRMRFNEALAAQMRRDLAIECENISNEGIRLSQQRLEARQGTRSELLQAELQLRQLQLQKNQAEIAFRGAWGQLAAAVGMPDLPSGTLVGSLDLPQKELDWTTRSHEIVGASPEVQAALARVAVARKNWERQRLQSIPNLSLSLAGGSDYGTNSGLINAEVGFNLPVNNRNQGNIAAAYAELCRASANADRTAMALQSRLAQAISQFETALLSVEEYKMEIIPRAEESITLAQQAFSQDELQFIELFVVRGTFFDSKFAYIQAQLELAQADAMLAGMLLSGSLDSSIDSSADAALRDQALNGQ